MQFNADQQAFSELLKSVTPLARGISGLRLRLSGDVLVATGSDMDTTAAASAVVTGAADGEVRVPAKLLGDIVSAMEPGPVTVEVVEEVMAVKGGAASFKVSVIQAGHYPEIVVAEGSAEIVVAAPEFFAAIERVVIAASKDLARPTLTGVLIERQGSNIRLVSTDSYRLAFSEMVSDTWDSAPVIVPAPVLASLAKFKKSGDEVRISFDGNVASFKIGSVEMATRLIAGAFPEYSVLIPEDHGPVLTVDREGFTAALKRVLVVADSAAAACALSVDADHNVVLRTTAADVGTGFETMAAQGHEGSPVVAGFNASYLLEGVDAFDGDHIRLSFSQDDTLGGVLKPVVLTDPDEPQNLYLLMPVVLS